MTLDLALQLDPDGETAIKITVTDPAGRRVLPRSLPVLDPGQLDALRLGASLEPTARPLAEAISDWLLGKDLVKRVTKALGGANRLRFVVRMHPDLAPVLGDLPVEIVALPKMKIPLVLHPNVESIVRVPPFVVVEPATDARDWPFRVLIVRSNPSDLGGAVPPVQPLVDEILDAAKDRGLPDGAVQLEVVSSEAKGSELATWERFRKTLGSGKFDVFVYLGHGDLTVVPGTPPIGKLQFEDKGGRRSVDAGAIVAELAQHPVRVVVLAGCLTAAQGAGAAAGDDGNGAALSVEDEERRKELDKNLPSYLRGAQGVAQAIVADAPVELAVGMRDLLEVKEATIMLGSFFRNLVKDHPGDVERAIREARSDLFGSAPFPPAWSSAVVFAKGAAPTFEFMTEMPAQAEFLAAKQKDFDQVRTFRQTTARLFLEAVGDRTPFLAALGVGGEMDKGVLKGDAMVRPLFVQAVSGAVTVPVELVGSLDTRRVTGKVSITGENVTIDRLVADPRIQAANFILLQRTEGAKAWFSIDVDAPAPAPLAPGRLFTVEVTIGSAAPAIHEVVITRAATEPDVILWSGTDVIAVAS